MKRYVYELEPSDSARLCDEDMGVSDSCALDSLIEKEFLCKALLALTARQERIVRLRFGIAGIGEHTLREIGEEIGVGPEAVRQILKKSLRRMRYHARRFDPERYSGNRKPSPTMPAPVTERKQRPAKPRTTARTKPVSPSARHCTTRPSPDYRSARPDYRLLNPSRPSRSEPTPPLPGILLLQTMGLLLFAVGVDPAIAYNVTKVLGAGISIFLHAFTVVFGVLVFSYACDEVSNHGSTGMSVMNRWWMVAICLSTCVGAVFAVMDPFQEFLIDMVAATPPKFRSPTAAMIMWFSTAIFTFGTAYISALAGRIIAK